VAPARPGERQPAPLPTVGPATDLEGRTEKEWKERVSILKSKSSASEAEVKRLEEEARRLENDFFAWSDGSYRDGVIKPAWEKAKADLRTARENLDAAALEVSDLEEEARKSGAPPGWLR
jgi:exonuclease VII small subunit